MLRAIFSAIGRALRAVAYAALWLVMFPIQLLAPRGRSPIPPAPVRPASAASGAVAPAQIVKADPPPGADLELQAAAAVSLLYRRCQGWSWRDQLSTEKFSAPVLAWLQRLSADEARVAVKAGKSAIFGHLAGKGSIDGLPALYGGRHGPARGATLDANRRQIAAADESVEPYSPCLSASRI